MQNVAPTLTISGAGSVNEGSTYSLSLSSTDPGADTITSWKINWGDGNTETIVGDPSSATHVYADGPNSYTISATATDEDGTHNSNSIGIAVNNVAPTLTISGAASVNEGSLYTLTLASSDPGQDTITSWTINWGDGNVETIAGNPVSAGHTYADGPNSYTISATATDEDGTYDANTVLVQVNNVAPTLTISGDASVNEGSTYTLNLASTDPGADTITSWTINWGDGSAPQVVSGNPSSATHVYADGPDSYTISAAATDEDGTYNSNSIGVTVDNVAPTLTISGAGSVNEGSTYTLNLASSDPGTDTITSWTIDWGDGNVQTVTGNPSSVTHVYADDEAGAADDVFTISATATDEDGTYGANTLAVTVNNVDPTATNNTYGTSQGVLVIGNVISDGTADSDPAGANDLLTILSHTAPANGTLVINADGSFTYQPFSTFSGTDTFTYTISDGDGGTSTATVTIGVAAAPDGTIISVPDTCLGGTALIITGTSADDHIVVNPGASGDTLKISINGVDYIVARPSGRIIVIGGAGDDNIQIAGSVLNTVWAYGEAGNDRLFGGGGPSLLIGGHGNDQLTGGSGRDVMIGGNGADSMVGNSGDDILIAGYTTKDARSANGHEKYFCGIMHEWNSANGFMTRVNNLRNGTGGNAHNNGSFFNDTTIEDDDFLDAIDFLNGSAGNDWLIFTKGEDKVVGQTEATDTVS